MQSRGVACKLTMTSVPPDYAVNLGISAAGVTLKLEPKASIKSADYEC